VRVLYVLVWVGIVGLVILCTLGALWILSLLLTGVDWLSDKSRKGKKGV
jgi:hypothetical protein